MKPTILAGIFLFGGTAALAQVDTSRTRPVDTTGVINQNDVYTQELPKDLGPPKDSVRVMRAALPGRLRRRLQRGEQYRGWEDAEIYLNRNTGLYMVYLRDSAITRVYGFDSGGKPVTVSSFKRGGN